MQTTVAVVGGTNNRVLFLDGRHQANDSAATTFIHRRIGLLPVVLHEHPRRALVVGLGGGATPGALSRFPGISVDVIELSKGVVEAAAYFGHINFDILKNPNVRIRLDDGRNFLQRVRTPYDVITADAIIPRHAGASSLNSVEYFRLVRAALAPRGVALHWNGGETEPEYQLILGAFLSAFPNTTLWGDGSLMVGTPEPLTLSRSRVESLLAAPQTRDLLKLMNVETFEHLERMFRASTSDIRAYLGDGPVLCDDQPQLEYFASLPQIPRDLTRIPRHPGDLILP
jgi:spermidine synthase